LQGFSILMKVPSIAALFGKWQMAHVQACKLVHRAHEVIPISDAIPTVRALPVQSFQQFRTVTYKT